MRKTSELEGAVLGIVSSQQPLTPYQIRKTFAVSPNPHWSASAGSIYPLVQRLADARLLASRDHATGARKGLKYSITAAGRRQLRQWILDSEQDRVLGIADLLRLRVTFISALTEVEQREFLDRMIGKLEAEVQKIADDKRIKARGDDVHAELTAHGALLIARARLTWLNDVKARLLP